MLFKDIIGQEEVKKRLLQSVIENKVAHALLFSGSEGVGKLPLALAFARFLCCLNRTQHDACGTCSSCVKFSKLAHPDLHFVFPIVKGESSSVVCDEFLPQWREMILEQKYFSYNQWLQKLNAGNKQAMIYSNESAEITRKLNLKSYESEYKVMIIWQPEKMHESCANKVLKILEEPPKNTFFILVTENPDLLLTTIQSRTQRINIPIIDTEDLKDRLLQEFSLSNEDALNVARIANGNYVAALENIQMSEENVANLNNFIEIMRLAYSKKVKEIKLWSDKMATLGREKQKNFLIYAQRMIRENFILNFGSKELNYMTKEEMQFSLNFAKFINERNVIEIMSEFELAQKHIEQNVNAKMVFFDLSLKFIVLLKK